MNNMEWIAPLIGISVLGTFFLTGFRMWLNRPHAKGLPPGEVDRLVETVETLHEQVHQLRGEMTELHERMDFAERLLTKGE